MAGFFGTRPAVRVDRVVRGGLDKLDPLTR